MESLFLWILNRSLTALWLIGAVILLRLCLGRAPKWIHCVLWIPVGLRLVCPLSFESVLSLLPSGQPIPDGITMQGTPTINSGIDAVDTLINPVLTENFSSNPVDSVNPLQVIAFLAAVLWIAGMASILLYVVFTTWRLHHRVRTAIRQSDGTWICDNIDSPFILGIIRPRIYLPSTLPAEHTAHVLAHERVHLQRRDHLWKPLGFAVLAVHWFNPLVWVAYTLLCRDIEMACDQQVIQNADTSNRKDYSNALLSCSTPPRTAVGCPLAFGEVGVKARIKAVLHYKKPAFWVVITAVLAGLATVFLLIDPPTATAAPSMAVPIVSHTHSEMNTSIEITRWEKNGFTIKWKNNNAYPITTGELYGLYEKTDSGWENILPNNAFFDLTGQIVSPHEDSLWLTYDLKGLYLQEGNEYKVEFSFFIDETYLVGVYEDATPGDMEEFKNYIEFRLHTDYSDVYSNEDVVEAKRIAERHFNRHFEDCTLLNLWYDETFSKEQADGWAKQYEADEAIVLLSKFETGNDPAPGFNPNDTYTRWNWVLVRDYGGKWELKTWGY